MSLMSQPKKSVISYAMQHYFISQQRLLVKSVFKFVFVILAFDSIALT